MEFVIKRISRSAIAIASLALIGAAQPERETKPGEGVLCLGGFIYYAQLEGAVCHQGKDPAYQARLDRYAERFDAYIIRNSSDGEASLKFFKEDEGFTLQKRPDICSSYEIWEQLRKPPAEEFDAQVDKLLERDGPPSFGDCV